MLVIEKNQALHHQHRLTIITVHVTSFGRWERVELPNFGE